MLDGTDTRRCVSPNALLPLLLLTNGIKYLVPNKGINKQTNKQQEVTGIKRKDKMGYNCSPGRLILDLEELFHYTLDEGKEFGTVTTRENTVLETRIHFSRILTARFTRDRAS